MVSGVTDINTDHGCGRATDPGMVLGHSSGPDGTMALGGSTGYAVLYGPRGSLTLKYGFGYLLRLQASAWPSGVTGDTDITTGPSLSCVRA